MTVKQDLRVPQEDGKELATEWVTILLQIWDLALHDQHSNITLIASITTKTQSSHDKKIENAYKKKRL